MRGRWTRRSEKTFLWTLVMFIAIVLFIGYEETHGTENELNHNIEQLIEYCF